MGLIVYAALLVTLFGATLVFKLGTKLEAPTDPGFWLRMVLLLGAGLGLLHAFRKELPLSGQLLELSGFWIVLALVFGVSSGMLLPSGDNTAGRVAGGVLLAVSEELFFRGYLGRVIGGRFSGVLRPTVICAVLYGLYTVTYPSVWIDAAPEEVLARVGAFTLLAGAPYAALYHISKKWTAPLLCHLTVNIVLGLTDSLLF